MSNDHVYLVFRCYSTAERPNTDSPYCVVFYGYTYSKDVVKAFISQRDKSKYKWIKEDTEVAEEKLDQLYDTDRMIDFVKMKSATTGETIPIFITATELHEAEVRIQQEFYDLPNLVDRDKGGTTLINLYLNLKERYKDILEYIGFIPPELDDPGVYDEIEESINEAYSGYSEYPSEEAKHELGFPGTTMLSDTYKKSLYSVESILKALRNDF